MTTERAYAVKAKMHELAQAMSDEDALAFPELFDTWKKGVTYANGEKVVRKGEVYRCTRKHVAKAGWEPEAGEKWEAVTVDG